MRTEISSDGTRLLFNFSPSEIDAVRLANVEGTLTDRELAAHWLANGEFQEIDPSVCGDLTSAPIYAIVGEDSFKKQVESDIREGYAIASLPGETFDVSVHARPVLARWGWMHYQVQSMVETVLHDGVIMLEGCVAPKLLDKFTKMYPPISRARFRIETEDGTQWASYSIRTGPYLTGNIHLGYTWDSAEEAENQRKLYETKLGRPLVVRPYKSQSALVRQH